jgi:hypothetical protein
VAVVLDAALKAIRALEEETVALVEAKAQQVARKAQLV